MSRQEWFYSKDFNPGNYIISRVLVYLRAMFIANSRLGFTVCEETDQDEPANLKGLLITDKNTWDTRFTGHYPSIVTKHGTITYGGGIQSGEMSRVVNSGVDLETTTMEIVTLPMVISCMARKDLEASSLASIVAAFIHEDKRWAKVLGLYGITPPQIGPSLIYDPNNSIFTADVSIAISVTKSLVAKQLPDHILKKLSLYINQSPYGSLSQSNYVLSDFVTDDYTV